MVKLSAYENRIIDGEAGKLKQVAMQNIVRYAEILGAQSLCEVTKATVFCGAHHYLGACKSEDFDVVFSRMNMASDEVLAFDTTYDNCYIQSCVSPCDHHAYIPYDIDQIKKTADYLKGKTIHPDVKFTIWTVYPIKAIADENGYTQIVEDAGGSIHTGTCPASIGDRFLNQYDAFVFDSLKQAECIKSASAKNVYYGDAFRCIDAAVSGKWEGRCRWEKS